jgi:hypothetical protein
MPTRKKRRSLGRGDTKESNPNEQRVEVGKGQGGDQARGCGTRLQIILFLFSEGRE